MCMYACYRNINNRGVCVYAFLIYKIYYVFLYLHGSAKARR